MDDHHARGAPPDPWSRLARLDTCCELQVTSELILTGAAEFNRTWRVTIHPPDGAPDPREPIVASASRVQDALTDAVAQAEARGWPNFPPKPPTARIPGRDDRPGAASPQPDIEPGRPGRFTAPREPRQPPPRSHPAPTG